MVEGIVNFQDWQKLDLRVGKIFSAERVENTDQLYKIEVDLGYEKRIIVSGLVQYYSEEQLIGKKIIVFCNLEPRTIRGIESKGMLLAAVTKDEKECRLLQPDGEVKLGARIS